MNIDPIKLLKGSHADTGTTGRGCLMNVIAYLNGEPQITDQSPCVCVVVRPIAIWLNDFMDDAERQRLLPYIMRAMGSATEDEAELVRRAWLAVGFANDAARAAAAARAAYYAAYDAARAAAAAARAAAAAARAAARAAVYAARAARAADAANAAYAARSIIISSALRFLDAALPSATELTPEIAQRGARLIEFAR